MKRPVRGLILDVDGTLVDSNPAHACAWFEAVRKNGFDPGMAAIRAHIGMGADRLVATVLGIPETVPESIPKIIPKIIQDKREIFRTKYLPHVRPFRCADALVATLLRDGLHAVIASASGADESELAPLVRLVGPATYSVPRLSKAALELDPLAIALDRLGLYPVEVFMIGGSPFNIEAALRLGIRTIAFRCGGFPDEKLEAAAAIYDSPQSLLENFETSPIASSLLARPA
jgi:phosphoglycolate phosphatase-like HAD superfamily hydrolase